jgi:hypothetical protein
MSFEHISRPLRRAVAHAATLQAAQKIVARFGSDPLTAVEDVRRAVRCQRRALIDFQRTHTSIGEADARREPLVVLPLLLATEIAAAAERGKC